MALKALHLQAASTLARPKNCSLISSSQHCYQPKLASTLVDARISSPLRLKCRARSNLHGCADAAVVSRQDDDRNAAEIPIVLHPTVVFPGATVQLQTLEFRYRIMMHTLLQEGLTFGIVYSRDGGGVAAAGDVGCMARVVACEGLVDGRFFLTCVGGDRFRVAGVVRTKPYVVARVEVLAGDDPPGPVSRQEERGELGQLVEQVEEHIKNVVALTDKLGWRQQGGGDDRQNCSPSPAWFSFVVAREFVDDRAEQQALLRLDDTARRLAREGRYLERRSRYLAAIAAIKDAFEHLSCRET